MPAKAAHAASSHPPRHISVSKSAHILGLPYDAVPVDREGRLDRDYLPTLGDAVLVLTAGTTGRGVVDSLSPIEVTWVHVDAAWAGPLRLTKHSNLLSGIEVADSVAVSAHKWFFQPKDSALVLFKDPNAQALVSFGGSYLATPNIGVQGSPAAAAIPLLGTLLAWGRAGMARRIETCMEIAVQLAQRLSDDPRCELRQMPETGVINWRPNQRSTEGVIRALSGTASKVQIDRALWLRHVAANPRADPDAIWSPIGAALDLR